MSDSTDASIIADDLDNNDRELLEQPEAFSFYQTVSFLRRMHLKATGGSESEEEFFRKRLRVNSYLSLAFPPNDVVDIKVIPPGKAEKTSILTSLRLCRLSRQASVWL